MNIFFREVISELKAAGASWIQFDEPTIVLDLDSHKLKAFTDAYSELESSLSGLNVLVETYFADIPAEAFKTLTALKGVTAFGFDLVRGTKTLDLIKAEFPKGKYLFAGVVDGRNIWANDLAASLGALWAKVQMFYVLLSMVIDVSLYIVLYFFFLSFFVQIN